MVVEARGYRDAVFGEAEAEVPTTSVDASPAVRLLSTVLSVIASVVSCGPGAACEVVAGLWSVVLAAGMALVVLAMGIAARPGGA